MTDTCSIIPIPASSPREKFDDHQILDMAIQDIGSLLGLKVKPRKLSVGTFECLSLDTDYNNRHRNIAEWSICPVL